MAELYRSRGHEEQLRQWCRDRLRAWPVSHTTDTIDTAMGTTHLTTAGSGPDVCVFLPGTNFNAATSTGLLGVLAGGCRVVAADLPGQPGLSASERLGWEPATLGRWVGEVVDAARDRTTTGRLVLMGHSRGAAAALCADPGVVDSLVLAGPAGLARPHLTIDTLARSLAWLLRPSDLHSARLVRLMTGIGAEDVTAEPGAAEEARWLTLVARSTRSSGAPGPLPPGLLARWRGHDVRLLVGEHDVFFPPARLVRPAERHLGHRVDVVPGAGHLLTGAWHDVVATAVTDALRDRR